MLFFNEILFRVAESLEHEHDIVKDEVYFNSPREEPREKTWLVPATTVTTETMQAAAGMMNLPSKFITGTVGEAFWTLTVVDKATQLVINMVLSYHYLISKHPLGSPGCYKDIMGYKLARGAVPEGDLDAFCVTYALLIIQVSVCREINAKLGLPFQLQPLDTGMIDYSDVKAIMSPYSEHFDRNDVWPMLRCRIVAIAQYAKKRIVYRGTFGAWSGPQSSTVVGGPPLRLGPCSYKRYVHIVQRIAKKKLEAVKQLGEDNSVSDLAIYIPQVVPVTKRDSTSSTSTLTQSGQFAETSTTTTTTITTVTTKPMSIKDMSSEASPAKSTKKAAKSTKKAAKSTKKAGGKNRLITLISSSISNTHLFSCQHCPFKHDCSEATCEFLDYNIDHTRMCRLSGVCYGPRVCDQYVSSSRLGGIASLPEPVYVPKTKKCQQIKNRELSYEYIYSLIEHKDIIESPEVFTEEQLITLSRQILAVWNFFVECMKAKENYLHRKDRRAFLVAILFSLNNGFCCTGFGFLVKPHPQIKLSVLNKKKELP